MTIHKILVDSALSGFEYGMLYDFQAEIARITGADFVHGPHHPLGLARHLALGTRYAGLRCLLHRSGYELDADVLWVVMMGPEAWHLDLHRRWDRKVGFRILYLFDTMERQIPTIRRVLKSAPWDLTITSFSGAVSLLEAATQRKWFAVPQGVKLERFLPVSTARRVIEFSAYGRRLDRVHDSVRAFCRARGMHYGYTTTAHLQPGIHPCEQYDQYAWHLRHSMFNFCWPVEMTHPGRVRSFSPVTCRWFEAAASATVVVGRAPSDPGFGHMFGNDFVIAPDPALPDDDLQCFWRRLWDARSAHLERARERYLAHSYKWTWETRVRTILNLVNQPAIN